MKYMLQVRFKNATAAIGAMPEPQQRELFAEFAAIGGLPEVLDGNQLQPTNTASTVHVEDGEVQVVLGPDGARGSALDGYYICDVPDLDAAIALAARIPVARLGGTVEVRGLFER